VAIVRIDPARKPGSQDYSGEAIAAGRSLATGNWPGAAIAAISAGIKAVTSKPSREEAHSYHTVPIEIDTDTGRVTYLPQDRLDTKGDGHGSKKDRQIQVQRAAEARGVLEEIYRTGVMAAKKDIPTGYREIAKTVLELSKSNPWQGPQSSYDWTDAVDLEHSRPKREQPDEDFSMGGFLPPGGLAGFSQMMPASKIALTRGGRGRSRVGTKRRKTRRKTAKASRRRNRPAKKAKARKTRGRRKLVKGSAAAKRYMASIRRKRR
jgi:hypothetical protein